MKYIIAVLLSAVLIVLKMHTPAHINNSVQALTTESIGQTLSNNEHPITPVEPQQTDITQVTTHASTEPEVILASTVTGCEQYLTLINQYSWDSRIAFAIMRAENTGCNPSKDNRGLNRDGSVDYGLFQINSVHSDMVNGNLESLRNAETNIRVAYRVYLESGWKAWTTYKNGKYLQYL